MILQIAWSGRLESSLLTSSLIYPPSFQGGPTIFHKEIFLKQTPFTKN